MTTEITWTVLPNGLHNGKVRATLCVSPRLSGGSRLEDFELMRNWPTQLVDAQGNWKVEFKLRFSGSSKPIQAIPYHEDSGPRKTYRPDPELWSALLPLDTFVRNYDFQDLSKRRIHSFPTMHIKSFIDQQYREAAVISPTKLPRVKTLLKNKELRDISLFQPIQLDEGAEPTLFAPGGEVRNYAKLAKTETRRLGKKITPSELLMADVRRHVDTETDNLFKHPKLGKVKAIPTAAPNARTDFMQLKRFHVQRKAHLSTAKIKAPELDFHGFVTAYGQHPTLLRLLGLAIDVEMEAPPPGKSGLVWVEVTPRQLQTRAPQTNYQYRTDGIDALAFTARSKKDSDIESCCLGLGRKAFSVLSMDVNSAGENAMKLAVDVQRATLKKTADTKERTGLPSLQTSGISLIRTGAAPSLVSNFEAQKALNQKLVANKEVQLWADDLLRGYRIDVLDGTSGQWRSLCRRKTTYYRTDNGQSWFEDYEGNDGWVSSAVTESAEDDDDDLYLQESLFRWNGWSLVAPRPGNTLSTDYKSVKQESEAAQPLNLKMTTEPSKGSLPRLRYGFPYKLRSRAVDLAGNSLTLDEVNSLTQGQFAKLMVVGEGYIYRRLEPIAQPTVLSHDPLAKSNGESVERLVIRSYNYKPELDNAPTPEVTQRHILPTGTSQLMAEMHGQFDDAQGSPQPSAYSTIIDHDNPLQKKDGVYHQPSVPIPYLPDPAGRGAAFAGLPTKDAHHNQVVMHSSNSKISSWQMNPPPKPNTIVHQVDFGPEDAWPNLRSFRLKIVGTQTARNPLWDAGKREFSVFIKPGEIRKVRLSSYVLEKDLNKFETWNWLKEAKKANNLKGRVLAGLHWMLTPFRELTLVHAVQQPLITPQFNKLRSIRKRGETWATLVDTFPIDGHSTLKLDVHAEWRDINDNTGAKPELINGRAYAFEYPVEYEHTRVEIGLKKTIKRYMVNPGNRGIVGRDQLKVLRSPEMRRSIKQQKLNTKQPAKYFKFKSNDPGKNKGVKGQVKSSQLTKASALKSNMVSTSALKMLQQPVVEHNPSRHEFGDTRYRQVTYISTATTRFLEYLSFFQSFKAFQKAQRVEAKNKKPVGDVVRRWEKKNPKQKFTRQSKPTTIKILSSARPSAPEIEYVIPTFGWERQKNANSATSKRSGGGLRVYLKRPWFSSGAGELLGVVVGQPPRRLKTPTRRAPMFSMDTLKPYITQWGMDPIWRSAPTPTAWTPGLKNFRNAVKTESNLTLEELPGARVSVAGYLVGSWDKSGKIIGFDEQRQLWYCDIELDPGQSYFPFVRLALVRYQPNSISWQGKKPGDVKLSQVVLTDFAQLAPDRFASVAFATNNRVKVMVTGHTYLETGADQYVSHAKPKTLRTRPLAKKQPAAATQGRTPGKLADKFKFGITQPVFPQQKGGSTMEVSLEASPTGAAEPLSWVPVPQSTVKLTRIGSKRSWNGEVTLPEPRGNQRYRLIIREFEWFVKDSKSVATRRVMKSAPVTSRLVYADVLEIH